MPIASKHKPKPFIITPRGYNLAWTDDDRLWLLRAVEAEGAPRTLVAQTLVNRFAWLWDTTPGKYLTLTQLVQAYSQPVNPRWFPGGTLFEQSLGKLTPEQRPGAVTRAERRRDVHATRTTFSADTERAVDQALYGPITLPMGALHFAAPHVARPDLPVLVPSGSITENTIYGDVVPGAARARYTLSTSQDTGPQSRKVAGVVALLALMFGVALVRGRP